MRTSFLVGLGGPLSRVGWIAYCDIRTTTTSYDFFRTDNDVVLAKRLQEFMS